MGLFGLGEVLDTIGRPPEESAVQRFRFRDLYPSPKELRRSTGPIPRGSLLGFFMGLIPGTSATISTFLSYALERRVCKPPEAWGEGVIEGWPAPRRRTTAPVRPR